MRPLLKCIISFIFLLIMTLFIVHESNALGIAPARKIIAFESGLEGVVDFKITNNENKDMKVVLYVEGELADLVSLSDSELEFSSGEDSKSVSYTYKLPLEVKEPGEHIIGIVAREIPTKKAVGGTSVGGSVAVTTQLKINVPYPGKYATADLKVAETGRTDQISFIVTVNNFGTQKIVEAKGVIDIFGPTNEKISTAVSESGSINPGERVDFNAVWSDPAINPGKYFAKLTVTYDGDVTEAERTFNVGAPLIEIKDISVKDFRLGDIAKFEIFVENQWSEAMKDVYTELLISKDGSEIGNFKSASENVAALSKQTLIAYWDTAGVDEGVYDAKVALYYDDKSTSKDMRAHISLTSIYFDAFGTGLVTSPTGLAGGSSWMVIGIIVLILINIGWFLYFKFMRKRK